ncbi:MAG TPA: ABC transporter permease [Candidatus Angelobacter sp.]
MAWISRLRALFGREKLAKDLEEELEFHLSMHQDANIERGMPAAEARREARLRFGRPSLWQERMGEIDLMMLPETVLQDLRYGARMLYRNAAFTIAAVLTLALGIGINVVAFTTYKAFFDRSLDARDSGKMVDIALVLHSGNTGSLFSYPDYEAYRDRLRSFSGLIAGTDELLALSDAGGSVSQRSSAGGSLAGKLGLLPSSGSNKEFAATKIVSENYFSVLGIALLRGRTFGDASELAASPAVLISENYWQRRFAGDPALLGQTIRLNGVAFTVVGITPRGFVGTGITVPDFWIPLRSEPLLHPDSHLLSDRENLCCRLFASLAPGVSIDQAQAEMTLFAGQLSTLHDPHSDWGKPATALVWPGSPFGLPLNQLSGEVKYAVLLIMLAVGMVLVIACANIASLQLARATSRQNELSMRLSLGASRRRLIRQLLTESALLGLLAGVVALLFSWALMKVLATVAAEDFFPAQYGTLIFHVNPDLEIFAYVFAISLAAGILFGLVPALESSGSAISSGLKANAGTSPARRRRLHNVFIAAQVAVALALMIAASLLIRSSIHALKADRGYDKQVVNLDLTFPEGSKYNADRKNAMVRELRTRLAAVPGVVAITHANAPVYGYRGAAVSLNGEVPSAQNKLAILSYTFVQANYFQTLGIPLLFGRNFQPQAGPPEPSVILSQSAAQQLWPGENPIGRSLRLGTEGLFHRKSELLPDGPVYQVIGVAGDTRGATFDGSDSKLVYVQLPEDRLQDYSILVRTQSDPNQVIGAIRPLISSLDPDLEVDSSTFEEMLRLAATVFLPRFAAAIASPVGLVGLLLASMGIYGTVSYIVVLRTREVGIRMALGAQKRAILGLMLQQCMRPVLAGLLAGMFLAVGASYLLRGALHGLSTVDGISFAGVSLLFLAIALFAAYVPSRRAMRVEPTVALRYE